MFFWFEIDWVILQPKLPRLWTWQIYLCSSHRLHTWLPIDKLVKKYKGDWRAKDLSCYNPLLNCYLVRLLGCVYIRDICALLEAHGSSIYHLGIGKSVNQSNLCRANEKRGYGIYEGLGMYLIGIVRPMYSNAKVAEITIKQCPLCAWLHGSLNKHCYSALGIGQV